MMKFEVLLSCMNREDGSILEKSNLSEVPVLLVNQIRDGDFSVKELDSLHRMICVDERGLSKSRNRAIENARGEICLLSDDDECFHDNLEQKIVSAYEEISDADLIVFQISNRLKRIKNKKHRMKKYELLRVSSIEISFRLDSIRERVRFDEKIGAGSENGGGGEEILFLLNCHKKGLKIYFVPVEIGTVSQEISTWFTGYNEEYFYKRGVNSRYIYGLFMSIVYGVYFVFAHRKLFKNEIGMVRAYKYLFKGIFENKI